jgi:hypothetical protein
MTDYSRIIWTGYDQNENHWEVKRYSAALPNLIHFTKHNDIRKLLDQVADWDGNGWSGRRWVPRRPVVPEEVRLVVEQLLQWPEVG